MNILIDEHRQLLLSLLNNHVSFILIGGYAVIYYGYERITGDMDIWLQPDNENRTKLLNALEEFGIDETDLEKLRQTDFTVAQVFYIVSVCKLYNTILLRGRSNLKRMNITHTMWIALNVG